MSEKQTLQQKAKFVRDLINQARSTRNPFTASELKKQIEPLVESLTFEAVETIDCQEAKFKDLQRQISRLDTRLSQLEL